MKEQKHCMYMTAQSCRLVGAQQWDESRWEDTQGHGESTARFPVNTACLGFELEAMSEYCK